MPLVPGYSTLTSHNICTLAFFLRSSIGAMPVVIDPHKGICFVAEAALPSFFSCGLDQLDWDSHISPAPEPSPVVENVPQTRKQRKQEKKQAVAARRRRQRLESLGGSEGKSERKTRLSDAAASQRLSNLRLSLNKRAIDDVVATIGLIKLFRSDIELLMPEQWLNDNNIAFVYEALWTHFLRPHEFGSHVYLMYPALVQILVHYPIESEIKEILPLQPLLELKLVFLPFNFVDADTFMEDANVGDHWALALLCVPEKTLYIYDSMAVDSDGAFIKRFVERIEKTIFKRGTITVRHMKCAQQDNFDDCGVYVIMFTCILVSLLLSGEPTLFDLANVRLDGLQGRLSIMELVHRVATSADTNKEGEV